MELVKNLPLSRRQMIEIAKALGRKPKILILDEATSALTAADVQKVYAVLRKLRDDGLAILYISHRMQEITDLADDCSVFRNGRHIQTFAKGSEDRRRDRRADDRPRVQARLSAEAARDKALAAHGSRSRISAGATACTTSILTIGRGEIVGLGGLDGQGQRELLLALFGVLRGVSGRDHRRRPGRCASAARGRRNRSTSGWRSFPRTARPRG